MLISFVISTFYAVIIAWAVMFAYFSFGQQWGDDTSGFLTGNFLEMTDPGKFGSIVPSVFIPLIFIWVVVLGVLVRGVRRGIEVANKIFIPTLAVLFLLIVIRAVTLDGALDGLNAFFQPNWDQIMSGQVWVAAYGQIFFSLSIGFAIMITYSSYLGRKSDITNNAVLLQGLRTLHLNCLQESEFRSTWIYGDGNRSKTSLMKDLYKAELCWRLPSSRRSLIQMPLHQVYSVSCSSRHSSWQVYHR